MGGRGKIRGGVAVAAVLLCAAWAPGALAAGPPPPTRRSRRRAPERYAGYQTEFSDPTGMPAGVVNAPCTPAADHPYPVVLVHGTAVNSNWTWQTLAPMLADQGYCVFALNYGANSWTQYSQDHNYALDFIENSAAQLANFVQNVVLPDTGATQVDIVGHSQGGMMPRYFIEHRWNCAAAALTNNSYHETQCARDDGDSSMPTGASFVHTLIGLAPSNHGADAQGIVAVGEQLFGSNSWSFPEQGCGACGEQEAGNPFLTALNGPDGSLEAAPGVLYYVIESGYDELVTPAPNAVTAARGQWPSAFLHGSPDQVLNVTLQDQCANDATEHLGIVYDPVALQDVVAALADNAMLGTAPLSLPAPSCPTAPVLPVISG